ncbi:MAG: hypothetical protein AB7F59_05810 [Bdellovibrionales bacterium]
MQRLAYFVLSALSFTGIFIALHSPSRAHVQGLFLSEKREILSTVVGDILGDGTPVQVVKIRAGDRLFLEVYVPTHSGTRILIDTITLSENRDSYFSINGQFTNLAVDDVDGDQRLEIVSPTVDHNLTAHLNVFKFNEETKLFQKVTKAY